MKLFKQVVSASLLQAPRGAMFAQVPRVSSMAQAHVTGAHTFLSEQDLQ